MKKMIVMLLVLALMLSLCACGGKQAEVSAPVVKEEPVETTLSPREQFAQQKEAMEELFQEDEPQDVVPCSFTAGGFTVNLDSSFTADYEAGAELMSYKHKNGDSFSYTMAVLIQPVANYGGYQTSKEAAEDIAAQKPDERTVGSANGVYYIFQNDNNPTIKAYYVDGSGTYWVVSGYTNTTVDFADYMDQLVEFCTTGHIG